jgi:MFS family permease
MTKKPYLTTVDVALTALFCALYITLNLTLGPLSFALLGLPILHDFGVFFTLLLIAWITGRFGTSLMAGIIGAALAMLISGMPLMIGFAPSVVLFDLLMTANHHKIRIKAYSLTITAIATILSAYIAGVVIGVFFTTGQTLQWALIVWGAWHVIGGILAIAVTFPVIALLEKANVRKIKGDFSVEQI